MSLNGYDIANVNGPNIITKALTGSFVICKASEGLGFRDGYAQSWAAQARAKGKPVGFYHFAHVGNDPTAEADYFLSCANPRPGDCLMLDFEPYGQNIAATRYPAYIVAFLQRVNARTGASCWLYLNDDMGSQVVSHATAAQLAVIHAAPLWKARYGSSPGSLLGWANLTCWQSSGTGIDVDTFYGDAGTWRALGVGPHSGPVNPATPHGATPQHTPAPTPTPRQDDTMGKPLAIKVGSTTALISSRGMTQVYSADQLASVSKWMGCLRADGTLDETKAAATAFTTDDVRHLREVGLTA